MSKTTAVEPRFDLVTKGAIVLWVYRGNVEEGTVLYVDKGVVALIWLEGYKSRNDDVKLEDLLSVHSNTAPEMRIFPFVGKGFLLPAGEAWLAKHPGDGLVA